ncbi:quercetin dioxygenase-like cupin family protein [Lentzea atacamensis]|uniref:Quercetin dioxygenase-like cupin family protein n=1 Tax=Lentzea atacamensis TaxID=531938 RepID=A0A316I3A3_9PSEU|nr:cupin domain-containing protein [Lentzea atacamensis]PWK86968.1 quercetin dioxygenase-like cupin family protein [Lentzea atacamensis]
MDIELVTAADGELIDNGLLQIRIIEDGSNTGHRLGITEVRLGPAAAGPPQHLHRSHEETFYVVSGRVRFTSGQRHADLTAGGLVTAPIGVPHTFANPDTERGAVLLVTYTPDRYIGYFRDMARLDCGVDGLHESAYLELMSRYDTEPFPPR